ncbi:MAG: hypothetical protein LBM93_09715 [Oscillospiraceae bacterium]|jgi:hypothetical protein|nr:hypothetical protein [Oscillospiraceae bacterium]
MKTTILIFSELYRIFKRNKIVFSFLFLTQIITLFAFLFFFSNIVTARAEYVDTLEYMRTFEITYNSDIKASEIIDAMGKNTDIKPENIIFRAFVDDIEILSLYSIKGQDKSGVGEEISQSNIDNKDYVAIIGIGDRISEKINGEIEVEESVLKGTEIGDEIKIGENSFKVIGVRDSNRTEIPYTTLGNYNIDNISVIIPPNISSVRKTNYTDFLESSFEGCEVEPPHTVAQKVFLNLLIPFVASLLISFFSVLTFSFLQLFLIKRCKKDFAIMKLCGCNQTKIMFIIVLTFVILLTLSFIIALCSYMIFYSLWIMSAVVVYVGFLLLLLAIIIINLLGSKTIRQEINEL